MEYTHFSLESDGAARKQLDADIKKKLKVPARRSSGSESAGWTQDMAALQEHCLMGLVLALQLLFAGNTKAVFTVKICSNTQFFNKGSMAPFSQTVEKTTVKFSEYPSFWF